MDGPWRVEMAEIVRAVGLRGEVKLVLTGDFLEEVLVSPYLRRWRGHEEPVEAQVESHRWKGDTVIVKLAGVADRDAAERCVGECVGFLADDYDDPGFPRPEQPAPFLYDGLRVETVAGETVGDVLEVMVLPAHLVLRVRRRDDEVLIPVIEPVVKELDLAGQRLVIEPIAGLLDDDAEVVDS